MTEITETLRKAGVRVGHLSDALDELGLPSNAGGGYQMLAGTETVFGRAFTLRQSRILRNMPAEPARHGEAARHLAAPGDVLVIDAGGATDVVTWGEAHTMRALANGLAGVVVHGATRDSREIARRGLPVLCRGVSPVRSTGRLTTVGTGVPVNIDGVRIAAGDLIAFDWDGLVAISSHIEAQVLDLAVDIMEREKTRDKKLEKEIKLNKNIGDK